jgi:hypothetical protein
LCTESNEKDAMRDHGKSPTNDSAPAAGGTRPDQGACQENLWSVGPGGEKFELPASGDYAGELQRLKGLAGAARAEGKEIVVVLGIGFVGSVMAAIIADTVDKKTGRPSKLVIGCDLPGPRSYWKVPLLNRGQSPIKAEDPEVDPMIARCVRDKKTLSWPPTTTTA